MTDPPTAALRAEEAPAPSGEGRLSISVETLAWLALLAAASALRLANLHRPPFAVSEAARALDAARIAHGHVPDTWSGDLPAALTSYLFRIFGEGEMLARLLPAAAGAALVAALWFARPWMGRGGALVAAFLLGLSPLFALFARSGETFSVGALLALAIVLSLFAYLREPRPMQAFLLAAAMALAPLTDAVAVSAALATLGFLALEGGLLGSEEIARAAAALRRSPVQWLTVILVAAAALELGLTHFGTSFERSGLPGLRQWTDMFDLARDGRAPEYYAALLLAYDWPLLLAGVSGIAFFALRLFRRGAVAIGPFQRFLLLWTALGALFLALATQREAGQTLIVLLPLALLAGAAIEDSASALDWSVLRRWWPIAAACLGLVAYATLVLTEWSAGGEAWQRFALVLALAAAVFLPASAYLFLGRNATALVAPVVGVLALAFAAHSALAVAFDDGTEFALDQRLLGRTQQLRDTVERLVAERGGLAVVDGRLAPTLGWPLRDSPAVFGDETAGATVAVAPADETPAGFVPLGDPWRVAQGWYPEKLLDPLHLWRWLVYREPYGNLETTDVRIYVPAP